MAEILPFQGIRYNPERFADFDAVVSPPYDVIGEALQDDLYQRSPYNIVRLDFGKILPGDGEVSNRYTRAAQLLRAWLDQAVLIRDAEPSIYYTQEEYVGELGEPKTREGFLASVHLEDAESGLYRPHEKTLAGPKEDRLRLMEACRCNLSPIFSLFDDPADAVLRDVARAPRSVPPLVTVSSDAGVVTRMWRVRDPDIIRALSETMRPKSFFVADGHHRYETALTYRDRMRASTPGWQGNEPWNYVLMYFANLWAPGLTVLPTHRVVFSLEGFSLGTFLARAGEHFVVEEVSGGLPALTEAMRARRTRSHCFGLTAKGTSDLWLLALRDGSVLDRSAAARLPGVLRTLDVTVLHSLILEEILGIDEKAQEAQKNLRYVKGSEELLRVVRDEDAQLGFLLNPTRVEEVKAVAEVGERMPQKSTFFYPKLVTGLTIHPLF